MFFRLLWGVRFFLFFCVCVSNRKVCIRLCIFLVVLVICFSWLWVCGLRLGFLVSSLYEVVMIINGVCNL